MKAKEDDNNSRSDLVKWILALIIVAAAIVLNQHFAALALSLRLIGWLVVTCMVAGIVYTTSQGGKLWLFAGDSQIELRKVVWPTRQETLQTTMVVIAMTIILGLLLWGVDTILLWAVSLIT